MNPISSSQGLIERIKNGDHEAFSALFKKHRPRLAVLIHYRLSPELRRFFEVDDILQETFLKAFRSFDQFTYRAPGSFMSWLTRIADHALADLARSRGPGRNVMPPKCCASAPRATPPALSPSIAIRPAAFSPRTKVCADWVERLKALPEDYRQAILLMKVDWPSPPRKPPRDMERSREATALSSYRALKRFRSLQERRRAERIENPGRTPGSVWPNRCLEILTLSCLDHRPQERERRRPRTTGRQCRGGVPRAPVAGRSSGYRGLCRAPGLAPELRLALDRSRESKGCFSLPRRPSRMSPA